MQCVIQNLHHRKKHRRVREQLRGQGRDTANDSEGMGTIRIDSSESDAEGRPAGMQVPESLGGREASVREIEHFPVPALVPVEDDDADNDGILGGHNDQDDREGRNEFD